MPYMYTTATPDRTDLLVADSYWFASDKPSFKVVFKSFGEIVEVREFYPVYYPEETDDREDPWFPFDQLFNLMDEEQWAMTHSDALSLPEGMVIWYE